MTSADEKNLAALEEKQCLLQLENKTKLAKKDKRNVTRPSGLFRKDNQDDLVSEYVELDSSYDVLKSHKMYIIWLKWLTHSHHVL